MLKYIYTLPFSLGSESFFFLFQIQISTLIKRRIVSWAANQHIRMISEGSCDTEEWRLLNIQICHHKLITVYHIKTETVILNSKNSSQFPFRYTTRTASRDAVREKLLPFRYFTRTCVKYRCLVWGKKFFSSSFLFQSRSYNCTWLVRVGLKKKRINTQWWQVSQRLSSPP